MNDELIVMHPISLGKALRKGFRAAWDHLGFVVFVTFVTFVLTAAVVSGLFALSSATGMGPANIALLVPVIFVPWCCALGIFYYANKSVFHEYPAVKDVWAGIKALILPALPLFVFDLIVTVVLAGDAAFFVHLQRMKSADLAAMVHAASSSDAALGNWRLLFTALSVFFASVTFFWLLMLIYHLPLLPAQMKMESGPKWSVVLRKSFLLVIDNPGFTVGLFLVIIAFAVLCALPGFIGMVLVFVGAVAFILTHALRELFIKYGIVEEEPEVVEEESWGLPDSWLRRNRQDDQTE